MGLIDRFGRALKSNLNSLIDKAEDPGKVLAQTIEDMQDELKKARQEVVSAVASVKVMERKQRDLLDEAASWERRAVMALEQGDEELAREALKRKKKAEGDAVEGDQQREAQLSYANELRATIDQLEKKVEELKAKKAQLSSQVGRARAAAGNTDVGGANSGAIGRIKEMQDRIANMEAEVEAHEVLQDPQKADLEERFRRLERGDTKDALEDDLAALKSRLRK